jgi:uncharacterized membrane protein
MTVLLVIVILMAILTYQQSAIIDNNAFLLWAFENHMLIMIFLVIVSIAYGLIWAKISTDKVVKSQESTKHIVDVLFAFLSAEEKILLEHLIKKEGNTTQAEIARLSGFDRVKAFRIVSKLCERGVVDVTAHGKIRNVTLKYEIYQTMVRK